MVTHICNLAGTVILEATVVLRANMCYVGQEVWRRAGATGLASGVRLLNAGLALYLGVYLCLAGLLFLRVWEEGGHPTLELRRVHDALEGFGYTQHHANPQHALAHGSGCTLGEGGWLHGFPAFHPVSLAEAAGLLVALPPASDPFGLRRDILSGHQPRTAHPPPRAVVLGQTKLVHLTYVGGLECGEGWL